MLLLAIAVIYCSILLGEVNGGLIGSLPNEQHGVSGQFYIVDSKTIFVDNFNYDGGGPGAFLYYYRPGVAVNRNGGGFNIPLPPSVGQTSGSYPGSFQRRRFTNEDFMVTLPDGVDACDIGTITIWCQPFRAIFTRLAIPRSTFLNSGSDPCTVINPGGPPGTGPEFNNCKVLHDTLHLSWRVDYTNSRVRFQLCGCTATSASTIQYLGFGLSGSTTATSMFQADATIAWVDRSGMAQAQDYYLSNYVQCRGGSGACPDTVDTTTGRTCTNDVSDVSGFVQDGQQCISFTRPFNPSDNGTCDRPITPSNQNQYIVWGIGSLGETAFQHHTRAAGTTAPLHLGRDPPINECTGVQLTCQQCEPFPTRTFIAQEDATFEAVIGPSANPRGYTAITGQAGWGIAWYINNTLVPELVVERGRTYTFLVYGGAVPADSSNYHPFYITDSVNGGRLLNTPQERTAETVYAGFDSSDEVTTVGPLCEYSESSVSEVLRQTCNTYDAYMGSLNSTCQPGAPGRLVWTPNDSTPDVVYYQCASHLNLGWRINVTDASPTTTTTALPPTTGTPPITTGSSTTTTAPPITTDSLTTTTAPPITTDSLTTTTAPPITTDSLTTTIAPIITTDSLTTTTITTTEPTEGAPPITTAISTTGSAPTSITSDVSNTESSPSTAPPAFIDSAELIAIVTVSAVIVTVAIIAVVIVAVLVILVVIFNKRSKGSPTVMSTKKDHEMSFVEKDIEKSHLSTNSE